jgi:inner membrane protein involved in colicin E2 resistance
MRSLSARSARRWSAREFPMWAVEALKEWHDFYVLVGTASATMLGLLFIAVSLGTGFLTEERHSATRTFMSPVIVHFATVFFVCAVALIPSHRDGFIAALIGTAALIGAILSAYITIQVVRTDMTNYVEDYLAYGVLPGLGYIALLAAAVAIDLEKDLGLDALAGALLLLVVVNIRNAWDLMLTMVRMARRHNQKDEPTGQR